MWKDTGIKLGIVCENKNCGYCLLGKCIFPQREFCLNISENGTCENFIEKEKRQKDVSIIFDELRAEILADKYLYDSLVASIASALKEAPIGSRVCDLARVVADRIIGVEERN